MSQSFAEIVGNGPLFVDAARTADNAERTSDRAEQFRREQEASDRVRNLWAMAVARSKRLFGTKRLWRVQVMESRTLEVLVKGDAYSKDQEATRSLSRATTLHRNAPVAFKYFVRQRLRKGAPADWVEVVYDFVDPLDFNSPRAWQLRPTKEQLAHAQQTPA